MRSLLVLVVACSHPAPAPHVPHRATTRLHSCGEERVAFSDEFRQGRGSLRGDVQGELARSDGEPAIGVTVVLTGRNLVGEAMELSDETGHYELRDIPPGDYTLTYYYENGRVLHPIAVRSGVVTFQRARGLENASGCDCIEACPSQF